MDLGQRINSKRRELQITQQELAQELKLTSQHVSAIETGKKVPSLDLAARMAARLGVTIDYLVSGKEGTVKDIVSAIRADTKMDSKVKKVLISLVEELRKLDAADNA